MAFRRNNGTVFGNYGPSLFAILTNDVSPMTRGEAAGSLLAEYIENSDCELPFIQMSIPAPLDCRRVHFWTYTKQREGFCVSDGVDAPRRHRMCKGSGC